jgi:hypothetical protein
LRALPYLIIVISIIAGAAYMSVNKRPLIYDWEAFCPDRYLMYCERVAACQGQRQPDQASLDPSPPPGSLSGTMNFLLSTDVQQMLNADATGLAVFLLALGTFAAGVVAMALAVPAIAWIEESALILVLAAADFICWRALFGGFVTEAPVQENFRAFGFSLLRSLCANGPTQEGRPQWLVKVSNQA